MEVREAVREVIVALINSTAVISVVAYILSRSHFYDDFLQKRITWKNRLLLILIFGLLSIYGTASGFKFMGAFANTRDIGPALAGLFAGPLAGIGRELDGAFGQGRALKCDHAADFLQLEPAAPAATGERYG